MNRDEAVSECAKTGALLAEIHDRPQQKALYDFAASKLSSKINFVRLWLGMEYDTSVSDLLLFNDLGSLIDLGSCFSDIDSIVQIWNR